MMVRQVDSGQAGEMRSQDVTFVVFDGFQILDLTGPHEVFSKAGYRCRIVAPAAGPVRAESGMRIQAEHDLPGLDPRGIDTLIVVGGDGVYTARQDRALVEWTAAAAAAARRVASICSGAFLLAAAGLLNGRRVTTHWQRCEQLAREHPEATVDCDPIFIHDRGVWTSAGITAGMDLALALVEDDHGPRSAHAIARELVLFLRRPGNQSQFGIPLWSVQPSSDGMRAVVEAIHADPGAPHGISDLAARARISPRHLQRRFTGELGISPAAYVERVRVEAAQRALVERDDPVEAVARHCGFGTAETLRRAFHRLVGIAPSDYRDRFRTALPADGSARAAAATTQHRGSETSDTSANFSSGPAATPDNAPDTATRTTAWET
ncbi:DJ-1/PfpI family protein [Nonomuraea sp. NPDC005650]|uniref:GlxA family transcriptional regulator n=1 Tax=Nonomuraea sp. NPDC005650 TaxID=3157045 RepID=UPI0033B053B8